MQDASRISPPVAGVHTDEKIWARRKVDDYMSQDWLGIQHGQSKYKAEIAQVGLDHSLATQHTSFVAVETKTVVQDGKPVRVEVPVELPEHVSPLAVPDATAGRGFGVGYGAGYGSTSASMSNISNSLELAMIYSGIPSKAPRQKSAAARPVRNAMAQSKFSPDLRQLYDCSLMPAVDQTKNKCSLPASGKIAVQVQLSSATEDVLKKLSKAGMKIKSGEDSTTVTGEISVSNLEQLVDAGEIDEFDIQVIPTFIGKGIPLVAPRHRDMELHLRSTRKFADGVVQLRYEVGK